MKRLAPTYIIADESGKLQLAKVDGELSEAQDKSEALAKSRGAPVVLFLFLHVATLRPPAVSGAVVPDGSAARPA